MGGWAASEKAATRTSGHQGSPRGHDHSARLDGRYSETLGAANAFDPAIRFES